MHMTSSDALSSPPALAALLESRRVALFVDFDGTAPMRLKFLQTWRQGSTGFRTDWMARWLWSAGVASTISLSSWGL